MTYDYRYRKRYDLDRQRGIERMVDGTEVRRHIDYLLAWGASYATIAAAVGAQRGTIRYMRERTDWRATKKVADKVLALDPGFVYRIGLDTAKVPNHGSVRRVQGLLRIGYTHDHLRERTGIDTRHVLLAGAGRIALGKHRAIAAVYDELHMTLGPNRTSATRAAKNGYAPPLAWDDIDDPNEIPEGVAA